MNKDPIVYVAQEVPHLNMVMAREYGEIKYVFPPGDVSFIKEPKLLEIMENSLDSFSERDYLVLVGDPELLGLAFTAAANVSDVVRLLKYDRLEKKYRLRTYKLN